MAKVFTLGYFIEVLERLERRYGPDLPVELPDGVLACPPVINPVVGRYAVVIHPQLVSGGETQ